MSLTAELELLKPRHEPPHNEGDKQLTLLLEEEVERELALLYRVVLQLYCRKSQSLPLAV